MNLHRCRLRPWWIVAALAFVAGCGGGGDAAETVTSAPVITQAPQSRDATEGDSVEFSVTAGGSAPLAYQWQRDGVVVAAATTATLSVPAVGLADDGASFTVRVSNTAGSTTSAPARLRVRERLQAPAIVDAPLAAAATVGQAVRFTVLASGSAPLRYQWQRDGSDIAGATAADLVFTASAELDGATYRVTVANDAGRAVSEGVRLSVLPVPVAPRLVAQPADQSVLEGERVRLKASVTGTPPFAWQWLRDGHEIGGAIGETLDLGAAALADSGARYSVRVSNVAGTVESAPAQVEVRTAPFLELLAGNTGGRGNFDGAGTAARIGESGGIAYDAEGNLWLADLQSGMIRKLTPAGVVTTVAGEKDEFGGADGPAAAARFFMPFGVAPTPEGDLVITDYGYGTVRRLSAAGQVTTIAGKPGVMGYRDGPAADAQFRSPAGVVVGRDGSIFVVDAVNGRVREITPDGQVSTLAGGAAAGWGDGVGTEAGFSNPMLASCATPAIVCEGAILVVDQGTRTVRRVRIAPGPAGEPKGEVTTLAGGGTLDDNAPPTMVGFPGIAGVTALSPTRFLVSDVSQRTLREVDLTTAPGTVRVVAGTTSKGGWGDGRGTDVRFDRPGAIALRPATGEVAVLDGGNASLRRFSPNGAVITLAGRSPMHGAFDGAGGAAHFTRPGGAAIDGAGTLYLADQCAIRRIVGGVVSTFAGAVESCGHVDGAAAAARFGNGLFVAVDADGVVWVADRVNKTVRRIGRDGLVTTVAGATGVAGDVQGPGGATRFRLLSAIAVDTAGDLVVADTGTCRVLRVESASGNVTSIAGDGSCGEPRDGQGANARFWLPTSLAVTHAGEIWVFDGNRIRRVAPDGTVSPVAGGAVGSADGTGAAAQFYFNSTLAPNPAGGVLLADLSGLVREVLPNGEVRTLVGVRGQRGAQLGAQPRLSGPVGIAYDRASRRLIVVDQGGVFSGVLP